MTECRYCPKQVTQPGDLCYYCALVDGHTKGVALTGGQWTRHGLTHYWTPDKANA